MFFLDIKEGRANGSQRGETLFACHRGVRTRDGWWKPHDQDIYASTLQSIITYQTLLVIWAIRVLGSPLYRILFKCFLVRQLTCMATCLRCRVIYVCDLPLSLVLCK